MTERMEEIKRRHGASNGGKWWVDNDGDDVWGVGDSPSPLSGASYPIAQNIIDAETADFIAHAGGNNGDVAFLLSRCVSLEALVRELAGALRTIKDYPVRDAMDVGFVHGRYARQELESCISGMRNEAAYALSHPLVSELTGEKEGGE